MENLNQLIIAGCIAVLVFGALVNAGPIAECVRLWFDSFSRGGGRG